MQKRDVFTDATSIHRLMLNKVVTLTEYERELIVERANASVADARQKGRGFGRQ